MVQLAHWALTAPERIAAHFPDIGRSLRFDALDARANRAAQWLISLGLQPGEGIALLPCGKPSRNAAYCWPPNARAAP